MCKGSDIILKKYISENYIIMQNMQQEVINQAIKLNFRVFRVV